MLHKIQARLPGDFPWEIRYVDSIASTNTALRGAPHGSVLIAGHQTGGRGRMGRSFHSPAGKGLYLSVLLRPQCHAQELMHLTCAAAVAAMQAGKLLPSRKPDIDNVLKIVLDALNGVAYKDDSRVVMVSAKKVYSYDPKLVIEMKGSV